MRSDSSDGEAYLPDEALRVATNLLMVAELKTHDYFGAWQTAHELHKQEKDPTRRQALEDVAKEILKLKNEAGSFDVKGEIDGDYNWSIVLLKKRFSISVESGRLAELKLYCPTRYVGMRFDESLEYNVAAEHGYCRLGVVGDPKSQFILTQR